MYLNNMDYKKKNFMGCWQYHRHQRPGSLFPITIKKENQLNCSLILSDSPSSDSCSQALCGIP